MVGTRCEARERNRDGKFDVRKFCRLTTKRMGWHEQEIRVRRNGLIDIAKKAKTKFYILGAVFLPEFLDVVFL